MAAGEEIQYDGEQFKEVEPGEGFENLSGESAGGGVEVRTNCHVREKIYPGPELSEAEGVEMTLGLPQILPFNNRINMIRRSHNFRFLFIHVLGCNLQDDRC